MFDFQYSTLKPNEAGPIVEIPATASTTYKVGHALVLSSGAAVLADTTTAPTYICMENYTAPATGMREVKACPVNPGQVWKCPVNAAPTSLAVGSKVTMNAGIGVTATTTSGVATVVNKLGATAANDLMLVRFE